MIELLGLVGLLVLGYAFGTAAERRHLRSIRAREESMRTVMIFSARVPPDLARARAVRLVTGSVCISVDYFKSFVAGLRGLVGGRLTSYEGLIDRARREAILRMKQDAEAHLGPCKIFNVKLETASISKGLRGTLGTVEVLAYGTAVAD
jgi:uncharacterized protein YbjQ (UPF0145 family)